MAYRFWPAWKTHGRWQGPHAFGGRQLRDQSAPGRRPGAAAAHTPVQAQADVQPELQAGARQARLLLEPVSPLVQRLRLRRPPAGIPLSW